MALLEFFGCSFLAFGPPLSLFIFTVAKDPIRIIILIASAFFWLLSLLVSSLVWLIISALHGPLAVGLVFSVLFQELFRFIIYLILRRAEMGLKKLTDANTSIITNKNILAYVSGLGFGVMSGAFSLVNLLADSAGPGTVGLNGDSELFFVTSSATTLCFILLHTAWGVLFFHSLDQRQYLPLCWVVFSHLLVSCLTLLNEMQLYVATLLPAYMILLITCMWSVKVAGMSWRSLKLCISPAPRRLEVAAE